MPGIYLLRRRWAIASDDFVFPSIAELCLRVAWLITIAVLFGIHHGSFGCPNGFLLRNYYIGAIVILTIGIIHTAITMGISMRGTIRDDHPRRHISIFLYLKVAILLPEAVWVIIATYWTFGFSYTCDWTVYWAARGAVICAWIVGFWIFVGILLVFDPLGSAEHRVNLGDVMSKRGSDYRIDTAKSKNIRVWETRCRCLCCCIAFSQENDQAFSDVSKLVADYFKDIDLVPSDIAAGLMLVEEQQKGIEGDLSAIVIDTVPSSQSGPATLTAAVISDGRGGEGSSAIMTGEPKPKAWMTIPMMEHYMKYALGSYGWPFYMYSNFFTGFCRLCASCRCCGCIREENQVYSDNVCECHTAAIRQLTKVREQDLIYVSFHNRYREVPFYVAVDRRFNNVVVSIRGTLSLQDALTDMSAKGVCLPMDGVPDATCHDAMIDCAQFIKTQLESKQLLERAFSSLQEEGSQLVIVGHSLGAGVAALLAVLLRPQYPDNLACFAFSPPGGLMSPSASRHAREYVCSVIVGQDIIPRLAMPSLCELKLKVLRALCNSNTPKYKILATGCFRMLCNCFVTKDAASGTGESAPLASRELRRYASVTSPLQAVFQDALQKAEEQTKEMMTMEWPVHPPGQIMHIVEEEDNRLCSGEPQYTACWAKPEDFGSILISHKMVLDHFPDVVIRALGHLNKKNFVPQARRMTGCGQGSGMC